MQELAVRVFPETGFRHLGDLTWTWSLLRDRNDEDPAAVWTHRGRTVAWAWLARSDNLLLQVDPAFPALVDEVLDWAAPMASGPLGVDAAGTERPLVAALECRGFLPADGEAFVVAMDRGLTDLPGMPSPPSGFAIRTQRDHGDLAGRVAAHGAAFGSTRMTTERYARMTKGWPYRPEFDLVVVSSHGDVVAYCQGWYDETNRTGGFEPVGTRPEYRGLGLARAVCTTVLHAFARAGGRRAVVCCRGDAAYPVPRRLYSSMGFVPYTRARTYRAAS
jgi:ribosomal protein S18 acetylase RimI-like enzyme